MRFSQTSLNMLARCGQQYYYRYIEGLRVPVGAALIVGRGVDAAVNHDLSHKIATGELLPDEQIADTARDAVVQAADADELDLGECATKEALRDTSIDSAVALARCHHTEAAPGIQPTHVQREWELRIGNTGHSLSGVIDVQEGSHSVRDTKTSHKSPSGDEAEKSMQLTMYSMATAVLDGKPVEKVALDYVVNLKRGPKLVQLESTRSAAQYQMLLHRTSQAVEAVSKGVFTPAPIDSWYCTEKWCGYWHICPYAARPVSVGVEQTT